MAHVVRVRWVTITTAVLLAACSDGAGQPARVEPSAVEEPASAPAPREPAPPRTANVVTTRTLVPRTHRIRIEDLPPPAADGARNRPEVVPIPAEPVLQVPAGFEVNVFAEGLEGPRWLRATPAGEVLVTETDENRIVRLADRDGDGAAEERETFADDDAGQPLDIPFGMAFVGEHFYVGCQDQVRRWPYARGQRRLEGAGEPITTLPGGGYRQHWTRNVIASADGAHLFVSIGSASNDDLEEPPRATIQIMDLDGGNRRTFASGLRNPVGLALQPRTGELWSTVVERDNLGDELVPDYLARLRDGDYFGWPWVYLRADLRVPRYARRRAPEIVARTVTPDVLFQAHSVPLGIAFYDAAAVPEAGRFPEHYRNGAFVAFRGSWNRRLGTGYGIAFVPFDAGGRAVGGYEDFLVGFLLDPVDLRVWGRPVGVVMMADGSLLFTEEANGRIYRVRFVGAPG